MPNILEHEELYDVLVVAGRSSPGTVKLSGHKRKIDWDVKDGPGLDGASMTRKSNKPREFTATFHLVTAEEMREWEEFAALLNSTVASATPRALDVYHPDLAAVDIKAIVLAELGGAQHDGTGGVIYAVVLTEYRPPKPKGGSPAGAKTKPGPDPNQDLQDEIARLTSQYQNTPWGL